MPQTRRALAVLLAAVLVLGLATSCSDDDGDGGATAAGGGSRAGQGGGGTASLDPCTLVTQARVEQIAGFTSKAPVEQDFGTVRTCQYEATGEQDVAIVTLAVLGSGGNAEQVYAGAEQMGGEPVEGLGDEALCLETGSGAGLLDTGTVTVRTGGLVLQAVTDSCKTSRRLLEVALEDR